MTTALYEDLGLRAVDHKAARFIALACIRLSARAIIARRLFGRNLPLRTRGTNKFADQADRRAVAVTALAGALAEAMALRLPHDELLQASETPLFVAFRAIEGETYTERIAAMRELIEEVRAELSRCWGSIESCAGWLLQFERVDAETIAAISIGKASDRSGNFRRALERRGARNHHRERNA